MQFRQHLLNVPNQRLTVNLMSNLFLCWMCVMLLYEMETTGNVSELHFTTLVENAIDWSVSHCLTPKTTSAVWKTNDMWRKVSSKNPHLKKKLSYSFIEKMSVSLWSNMPIKCLQSHKQKQVINYVALSFGYARHPFGQPLHTLFYSYSCKL